MGMQCARSPCHEDTARSSSSAPSELLMEEVLSACGWAVQPQTLRFLKLLWVACAFIRGLLSGRQALQSCSETLQRIIIFVYEDDMLQQRSQEIGAATYVQFVRYDWLPPHSVVNVGGGSVPARDGATLLWPGGTSVASFAAELLAGPMWGGRQGGPGCPSGQPGKRPRRSRLRRNAVPNRQHAEPLNMQTLFFFSLDGLPGGALGPPAGSAGSLRCEPTCVWSTESILPPNLPEQLQMQHQCDLASQFPASVAGRSRQRLWVSCVCSTSRFDAIEARRWRI